MKLLLVEDSERLRRTLQHGLGASGFTVDAAADGVEAAGYLAGFSYDLIVLDLMLPRRDGLAVLHDLPQDATRPRVLVLSARDQVEDRVGALNAGADDYLVKPFAFEELLARLHALARRPTQTHGIELIYDQLRVAVQAKRAWVGEAELALTPREFTLLALLLRYRGRPFSRGQIQERLAGSDSAASDKGVEVLVHGLRRKLDASGLCNLIQNRRGVGYLIP